MWVSDRVKMAFEQKASQMVEKIKESGITYSQVGVFGSYARNDYKATSDIDFCVVSDHIPDRNKKGCLMDDAEALGVDIVFVTEDYLQNDHSLFANNLRRDYRRIL